MKLAFSRPTSTIEEQEILFKHYQAVGYDGLQLKHSQYAPYIGSPEIFLEAWGNPKGVASALIAGGSLDEENQQHLRKLFTFAEKAGSEIIVFCHSLPRKGVTADDIRAYAGILSELGKEAGQKGVKLSLHQHYDNPVMYKEDIDVFFSSVKDDAVGLTVDTAHLVKSGITDVADIIHTFHSVIDNFHLKDFADGDWKVLGKGDIDFQPILQAIRDIGYNGWISADEESGDGIIEGLQECYRFMVEGLG
ncbi:sugar phosphate isomerase/epimerase family protein [Lederbergia graminis]|uniref:Sugar phosphate isomerase/epimerase family protein n=1 Tax=Lederbergia graminis TaxID=735518 RepID=A0ABW0LM82_9BACI